MNTVILTDSVNVGALRSDAQAAPWLLKVRGFRLWGNLKTHQGLREASLSGPLIAILGSPILGAALGVYVHVEGQAFVSGGSSWARGRSWVVLVSGLS